MEVVNSTNGQGDSGSVIAVLGQSLENPAFWVGFVLVALFAYNRFSTSDSQSTSDDPCVLPRSFTTRFRYSLSAIAYIVIYQIFFGLLVSIGSFPFLQEFLKEFIGTLMIPGNESEAVGTPTWATLVVTTVLPSVRWFNTWENKFRIKLQHFASIPFKARCLSNEIIEQLTPEFLFSHDKSIVTDFAGDGPNPKLMGAQVDWLFKAIEKLQVHKLSGNKSEAYKNFFTKKYQSIWNDAISKKKRLEDSMSTHETATKVEIQESEALLRNIARFLCCSLLFNEPSERDARNTIREKLEVVNLEILKFDFKLTQVILILFLVIILTFAGSIVSLGLTLTQGFEGINSQILMTIAFWLLPIAVTMAVPFIFAAGVGLYIMDYRRTENKEIPSDQRLLMLLCLFFVTFGIGIVPTLFGMVTAGYDLAPNWVMQVAPSGIIPAGVALLFYFLSSRRISKRKWSDFVIDLCLFALAAGFLSWASIKLGYFAGMDAVKMTGIEVFTENVILVVTPTTYAVMVGVIGAVQCSISRSNIGKRKEKGGQAHLTINKTCYSNN